MILGILIISCTQERKEGLTLTVEPDQHFNQLFSPDSGGITGADGLFSVQLPDGRSVFLTGDCFLGEVTDGRREADTRMLNNSMVVISSDRKNARAVYKGSYKDPETLFVPESHDIGKHWYWPGHAFADDSILYVFALNMYNDPGLVVASNKDAGSVDEVDKLSENQWAFQVAGIDLLQFSLPGLRFISAVPVESSYDTDIHFGNCVLRDGYFLYFFGTRNDPDGSHIYSARTRVGQKPYHTNWEYYDGESWTPEPERARPMKLDISVSEQFSIFKIRNRYVLLTHEKGSDEIYTYTSDKAYRDFNNKKLIYTSPEPALDSSGNLSAYNALAHPQYMDGDKLLVSYCLNSLKVRDVFEDADKYRGRFIRVPLSMIDSAFLDYQPGVRMAMIQMKVEGGELESNLAHARNMIDKAAGKGADLILLPEAMDLGWAHPSALSCNESIPGGRTSRMLLESAKKHKVYICSGLVEKSGSEVYNSALLISPEGEILIHHRKINILDIAQEFYAQGRNLKVVETRFGSIGLMICADGFADQRVITQTLGYMGADLIISPTSWALPDEQSLNKELATSIWYDHYAPVAKKFHLHIAGCSNVGKLSDGPWKGYNAIGNSMIIGPEGDIVAGNVFGVDTDTIILKDILLKPRPVRGTEWDRYFQ